MLSGIVIDIETRRSFNQLTQVNISGGLPAVPVMPETLLLMELCAQGRSVDLSEMAQVVLGDPGATIQIMREAGQECAFGEGRPRRIEDYISALGVSGCIEAASRKTVSRAMNKPAIARFWAHSIEIAMRCRQLADENMSPDEAYLTGLLHELGSLPGLFEWEADSAASDFEVLGDPVAAGVKLADEWYLPQCVTEYFAEQIYPRGTYHLSHIVRRAHEVSSLPAVACLVVEQAEIWSAASSQR